MITRDEANQIWENSQSSIEEKTIEFYEEVVNNLITDAAKQGFTSIEFTETSDRRMEIVDYRTGTSLFYLPPSFPILRELLEENGFKISTYRWVDGSVSWDVKWVFEENDNDAVSEFE